MYNKHNINKSINTYRQMAVINNYKHEKRIKDFVSAQDVPQRFAKFVYGKPKHRKVVPQHIRVDFLRWADAYVDTDAVEGRPGFLRSLAFGVHNHLIENKEISSTFLGWVCKAVRDTKAYKKAPIREIIQATHLGEYLQDKKKYLEKRKCE